MPPEADPSSKEKVVVQKVFLADAAKKREMYVFSDLHLGGHWSKETVDELKEFLLKLAKIAEEYVHTIVMLGDVLEMWMTPITLAPASKEEFVKSWKNHKVLCCTFQSYFIVILLDIHSSHSIFIRCLL